MHPARRRGPSRRRRAHGSWRSIDARPLRAGTNPRRRGGVIRRCRAGCRGEPRRRREFKKHEHLGLHPAHHAEFKAQSEGDVQQQRARHSRAGLGQRIPGQGSSWRGDRITRVDFAGRTDHHLPRRDRKCHRADAISPHGFGVAFPPHLRPLFQWILGLEDHTNRVRSRSRDWRPAL